MDFARGLRQWRNRRVRPNRAPGCAPARDAGCSHAGRELGTTIGDVARAAAGGASTATGADRAGTVTTAAPGSCVIVSATLRASQGA